MLLMLIASAIKAQGSTSSNAEPIIKGNKLTITPGLGLGLDYGGVGAKVEFAPDQWIGVFGGFGYNLISFGYNAGASFKLLPQKKVTPVLLAMYGYNAGLKIKTATPVGTNDLFKKTYYGPTVGAGVEIGYGRGGNKASISVLVPIRSKEFKDTYDGFKDMGYKFSTPVLPIAISVGIMFGGKK